MKLDTKQEAVYLYSGPFDVAYSNNSLSVAREAFCKSNDVSLTMVGGATRYLYSVSACYISRPAWLDYTIPLQAKYVTMEYRI